MFEVLFQYGPFTLRTFNIFLALSFLMGMIFLIRYVRRNKMPVSFLANHFIALLLSAFLGGRLLHVLENLTLYRETPLRAFYLWDLQLSAFGVFYGFMVALFFLTRRSKENFWVWLDACALAGLVGLFFIHVGHFFNGGHYGVPTDLPWGVAFDTLSIPFLNPIHPTQLYSALAAFLIFSYAMKYNRRTHLSGMVGNLVIILYAVSAFSIDFLHGIPSLYAKISLAIIAVIAFVFFIHCSHQTYFLTNRE